MKIIQIAENQKEIWNGFIAGNSPESFLQAWEWGKFNQALGRKIWRLGVVQSSKFKVQSREIPNSKFQIQNKFKIQNSNLIAVALVLKYDLPLGRSYLYCPRGPVIRNWEIGKLGNWETLDFLFKEIGKIARKEKSLFLRFDPPVEENLKSKIWNLEQNKFSFLKNGRGEIFKKTPNEIQPQNTLILDLTKSEEELLKEMKSKTRYNIRLAERKGVRIENHESRITNQKYFKKDFEKFWRLTEETARRDNFKSHNKNYYWRMLESCGKRNTEPECEFAKKFHSPDGTMEPTKKERKFSFPTDLRAKLYLAEYENKIIAANIVLFFGDYCVYLHGASSNKYRNVMAPYLLQWRQILDAKKMGCKKYDFWGVSPTNKDTECPMEHLVSSADWGGITRFKKGFGGEERNYIGAYDLVFDRWEYKLYKFIKRAKIIFNF